MSEEKTSPSQPPTSPSQEDSPVKRRNFYAYALLGSVLAMAVIGLLNVWDAGLSGSFSYKAITSLVVTASLATFLYTLTYNHERKLVKKLGMVTGIAAVGLAGVLLAQIWFDAFQELILGKVIVTFVIIGLLAAFGIAVADDFFDNKKLKDENYLD
jgi:hypothetical protein